MTAIRTVGPDGATSTRPATGLGPAAVIMAAIRTTAGGGGPVVACQSPEQGVPFTAHRSGVSASPSTLK